VTAGLQNLDDLTLWFDDHLLPGQDWKLALGEAIARSNVFVYAITIATVSSEWCDWELGTAARFQKTIIPVLLEPDVPVPESLKRLQHADFSRGTKALEVAKLMRALSDMQTIPLAEAPPIPANPQGMPSRAWETVKYMTSVMVDPYEYQAQNESEEIIEKISIALCRGGWFEGGQLILTNQRVLCELAEVALWARFAPGRVGAWFESRRRVAIPLSAIESVEPARYFGIVPAIRIRCRSGEKHWFAIPLFVRRSRKELIAKVETCRKRLHTNPLTPSGFG
jgi:hypothetical protein